MTGVRHLLLALIAMLGLSAAPGTAASACPAMAVQPMAMTIHHHHPGSVSQAPVDQHAMAACAACLAVMSRQAEVAQHSPAASAPPAALAPAFASFTPGLDPPPPRAA
jgi:hypothetical protein